MNRIESVRIRGFRSLADVALENVADTTVLIGANGSGESNFIRFFEMMSWMLRVRRLAEFVARHGGANDQLFGGSRRTPRIEAELSLRTETGMNDYRFALTHGHPDRFFFTEEAYRFSGKGFEQPAEWQYLGSGHDEARIVEAAQTTAGAEMNHKTASVVVHLLRNCAAFQFHDTSHSSHIKQDWDVRDNKTLRTHGGNLAPILYRLEHEDVGRFDQICRYVGRILPVFDRFELEESYGKISLRWKPRGMDQSLGAHLTSDGSLRFFALVTLLNLPDEMLPDVLLLDEPELGLHPAAVTLVADMIKSLATERQVIVATQSPLLVDAFDLDEIIVAELRNERTEFHRLDPNDYKQWLAEAFTTGELWQKNLIGGRP